MRIELFSISLMLAWMLSPESLVLLGNGIGDQGMAVFPMLVILVALSAGAALIVNHSHLPAQGFGGTLLIREQVGKVAALSLTLSSRLSVTLLASCAMLVTSGFAFNEIFVYWFPNFGFASLLLSCIVLVHIAGQKWARLAQASFMVILVASLVTLLLLGVIGGEGAREVGNQTTTISWTAGANGLLLFLGYDLVVSKERKNQAPMILTVLFFACSIFSLWANLSLKFVDPQRLADSTIPHLLVAREIAPPLGRYLMGIVIISGTCAAVNGFFFFTGRSLNHLAGEGMFPQFLGNLWQGRLLPVVFGIAVTGMMFTGLAGEEILEAYLRGSLLLWLLHVSVHSYAASRYLMRSGRIALAYGVLVSIVCLGVFLFLLFKDDNVVALIRFIVITLACSLAFSIVWLGYIKKLVTI